jgi:hypothetical protein
MKLSRVTHSALAAWGRHYPRNMGDCSMTRLNKIGADRRTCALVGGVWVVGIIIVGAAAFTPKRVEAVPAFADQTTQPCKACHVGGFGPELTPFGREFKLGGYTLRARSSAPLSAMAVASWTHTNKDQVPPPDNLSANNNLALDQVSGFLAGGVGKHLGGFVQVTYDGVGKAWSWDNLDLRVVTPVQLFGKESILGISFNNSPTVQDPWNTYAAWGFPYTDTAVSATPDAGPVIDGAFAQETLGLTGYAWINSEFYLEAGGYSTPAHGTLSWLGADPDGPGDIHGIAPYGRIAWQHDVGGGTLELGGVAFKAALFPGRDRSSGFVDEYTDLGLDGSWVRTFESGDQLSTNVRYVHETANLRASCALELIGDGEDIGCGRFTLGELRGTVGYSWRGRVGASLSAFDITGSANSNVFSGASGKPDSNGLMGQVDFTPWGGGKSPLGPRFNARVGIQYTLYGKFNGMHRNWDGAGANATDNNALRVFTWVAF